MRRGAVTNATAPGTKHAKIASMTRPLVLLAAALLATAACTAAADAGADAVIAAYVKASGGHDALARIQNRVTESRISMGWLSAHATSRLVRPDRFEDTASMIGLSTGSGYDGAVAWTRNGKKIETATGAELVRALRGHSLDWDRQIPTWYPVRTQLPDAEVAGVKVNVVEMTASTGEKEIWRFDAATGLLKQLEGFKFEKGKDPVKVVSTIEEYRAVDGVQLPWRITGNDGKHEMTVTVESLVHNTTVAPIVAPAPSRP
jgi:hypothetical protein